MTRGGLPHSDIFGSKLVCSSPKLFAACHVLHRLLAPRHSPYTLSSLTIRNSKLTRTNCLHISWSATVPCNTACPPSRLRATADECCGRKKLPCAEYSVVKDQLGAKPPCPRLVARGAPSPAPLARWSSHSTREANLLTSAVGAPLAQRSTIAPTSVRERLESLIHSPKLFPSRQPFGLWRDRRKRALSFQTSAALIRLACLP